MKGKRQDRNKHVAVIAGVVCALALVGVGMALWHTWEGDAGTETVQDVPAEDDEGGGDPGGGPVSSSNPQDDATSYQDGIPTVPDEWIQSPSGFESQEIAELYEQEWHTNKSLRSQYSFKTVVTDEGMEYVAGELLVYVPADTTDEKVTVIAEELKGEVLEIHDSDFSSFRSVTLVFADNTDAEALAERAQGIPEVEYASPNYAYQAFEDDTFDEGAFAGVVTDPLRVSQTYLSQSRFVDAWKAVRCDGDVTVAVIDSGVDFDHEDLVDNVDAVHAWDTITDGPMDVSVPDFNGHGTAVSGVISATASNGKGIIGTSYDAVIIPIRVLDVGGGCNHSDLLEAFDYILSLDDKPGVINMSLGGPAYDPIFQERINRATDYGIVCVAAVGNDSEAGHTQDPVRYPAGYGNVIGVGAVTSSDARCDFSNINSSVDLCALGRAVYTTTDPSSNFGQGSLYASSYLRTDLDGVTRTYSISGTSFSAPQVAAAAALVKARYPDLDADKVEQKLTSTARRISDSDGIPDSLEYGSGALDAAAAVGWAPGGGERTPYWSDPTAPASINIDLLTTYGVRDGSAGPDFMGITNTNFDFTFAPMTSLEQYDGYTAATLHSVAGAGLAIWATSVNENVNPYYTNLYYNTITPSSNATQATTWMSNPVNSWGDSNGSTSYKGNDPDTGAATIAGLEFDPDIIFGANKYTSWNLLSNGSNSQTNIFNSGYSATYTSNDATNLWTQVYTMGRLATVADTLTSSSETKETRYDNSNATVSAVNYEKTIRGNLLYVASQIDDTDNEVSEKTVAYLYAIDASGTGYFFVPTAEGLLVGDDTGDDPTSLATASGSYAANNSTINMGYMASLPFVTDTFDSNNEFAGGIVMMVEDIYKANPACTVAAAPSTGDSALANVDVIIYNSTTLTDLTGTTGGRNSSGVNNSYQGTALDTTKVATWAASHVNDRNPEKGPIAIIAGDDFATSTNHGYGTADTTADGMSPLLYCQRNYTADKNTRAAWAFAQVYPELYGNNADATYAYWVDKIYHVNTANVPTVVQYMTNQSDTVIYDGDVADDLETKIETGYDWWMNQGGKDKAPWNQYAFYNGSSRASFYSDTVASEEAPNTIGIFAPSALWVAAPHP